MTTIEIFREAKIRKVDRINRKVTASGTDSVTGILSTRTFEYVDGPTLDKAERFLTEKTPIVIDVDSSTKNINLRLEG